MRFRTHRIFISHTSHLTFRYFIYFHGELFYTHILIYATTPPHWVKLTPSCFHMHQFAYLSLYIWQSKTHLHRFAELISILDNLSIERQHVGCLFVRLISCERNTTTPNEASITLVLVPIFEITVSYFLKRHIPDWYCGEQKFKWES